jgi:hypothetical protein
MTKKLTGSVGVLKPRLCRTLAALLAAEPGNRRPLLALVSKVAPIGAPA